MLGVCTAASGCKAEDSKKEELATMNRSEAGRIGALALHAQGKTNTGPARQAFLARFKDAGALKEYMTMLGHRRQEVQRLRGRDRG